MLNPYRRHSTGKDACPHAHKGQDYSLCNCPIWAYGELRGEVVRLSLRTRDAALAYDRIRDLEGENGRAVLATLHAVKLATAVERYLEDCAKRKKPVRGSTLTQYKSMLGKFAAEPRGKMPVSSITQKMIADYGDSQQIGPGTWRKEIQTLRTFFRWLGAQSTPWIEKNPMANLKSPPTPELVTLPYTQEEVDALFDAASRLESLHRSAAQVADLRKIARALLATLLYSGLRISDVAALRRDAVTKTGHISIQVIKTEVPVKIKLHAHALAALEALPLMPDNPAYFFWRKGEPRSTCITRLRMLIKKLGKTAGVEEPSPHRCRDTFAVTLLDQGVDIRVVQKLLGHKSIKTTEMHYAHFSQQQQLILDAASTKIDFERAAARPVLVAKK
jgi:site-specific recombinase XerD